MRVLAFGASAGDFGGGDSKRWSGMYPSLPEGKEANSPIDVFHYCKLCPTYYTAASTSANLQSTVVSTSAEPYSRESRQSRYTEWKDSCRQACSSRSVALKTHLMSGSAALQSYRVSSMHSFQEVLTDTSSKSSRSPKDFGAWSCRLR